MNAATVRRPAERADPALARRVASGVVLVAAALLDLLVGGWLFTLSIVAVVLLMADEWGRLATDLDAPTEAHRRSLAHSVANDQVAQRRNDPLPRVEPDRVIAVEQDAVEVS